MYQIRNKLNKESQFKKNEIAKIVCWKQKLIEVNKRIETIYYYKLT